MKFVEIQDLEQINSALEFDTPDCKVMGGCDLYTTKAAGGDKKLYKSIDKQLHAMHQDNILLSSSISPPSYSPPLERSGSMMMSKSSDNTLSSSLLAATTSTSLGSSPFGPLDQVSSRRTFAYLIAVLNASHPDHDFSSLRPEDFKRERSPTQVVNAFNNTLFGVGMPVPPRLWEIVDSHIDLKDCVIYSHTPSPSFLADEPGTIWSMMWFFFNKRRKRVCYLFLKGTRHSYHMGRSSTKDDEGEASDDAMYQDSEDDAIVGDLEMDD
ncbi:Maf1 regulator-domain-containing protein [Kockiozyma suomiensis]|uniref:Maf1 regulator-domain-containing protein n=1 Tax=Kockiozyma suomiensis TaxID=1337062 RepID=UPI0033440F2E